MKRNIVRMGSRAALTAGLALLLTSAMAGDFSIAYGINNNGQVVGNSQNA